MNETDHEVMERAFTEPLKGVTVRKAETVADVMLVRQMLVEEFHVEHQVGGETFPLNPEKADRYIVDIFENAIVLVAERDGEMLGSMALKIDTPWWSDRPFIVDGWFYVRKAGRKSRAAHELLKMAETMAQGAKMPMSIALYNSTDDLRKDAFFVRRGYVRVGGWYVKGAV